MLEENIPYILGKYNQCLIEKSTALCYEYLIKNEQIPSWSISNTDKKYNSFTLIK